MTSSSVRRCGPEVCRQVTPDGAREMIRAISVMPPQTQDPSQQAPSALWRRDGDLPFQRMAEETIVVNPQSREVHLLNETAARIWELLEDALSVEDLVGALAVEYDGDAESLRVEVQAFIADLQTKGLIAPGPT